MTRPKIIRFCTPTFIDRSFAAFICITLLGVVLRYCWFDARDPFKCGGLLNGGGWLDQPPINSSIVPTNWQPPGCMMHKYGSNDVSTCLANRRVLFIGDATIRQVFWSVAKALDPKANPSLAEKHVDIIVEKNDVKLEFIWDPWLNSSRLHTELSSYSEGKTRNEVENTPALILMGCGLWYARHENFNGLKMWKDSIDDVIQHMGEGHRTTDMTGSDLLLLSPVTIPAWAKLNDGRKATITPEKISAMNQYLQQLSDIQGIDVFWSWQGMTHNLPQTMESSGIHVVGSIAARQADALLNLRCNAVTAMKYPLDNTCCNRYQAPNHIQWLGLLFVLAILPAIICFRKKDPKGWVTRAIWLPSDLTISALFAFGLAVIYCFYADRTQVFNKSHKQFFSPDFFWLSAISLALGVFSIRSSPTDADQPFLSRDQTHEWKGWMQFTILIYHYTGASTESTIYGVIRVIVAAYLFMTGFGHTTYFLKKKDYSFKRLVGVLIRLNLLSCVLPFMMGTHYLFYYFAPLCSYWFLVVYGTMRAGEKYNSNIIFLLVKIFLASILSAAFTNFPGLLETIFDVFGFVAKTEWDATEWRSRVSLDMWIVFVGMLVAIVSVRVNEGSSYTSAKWWISARRYAIASSAVALPLFFLFQMTRETKYVYNAYHPYVSFIPILAFIVLRNATPRLRNAHSRVFAWLGNMSLETFTLQFHIWMAADTKGLLDLGAFGMTGRVKNFVFSTILFFYASYHVAGAKEVLTRWIIGEPVESMAGASQQTGLPTLRDRNKDITVEETVPLAWRGSNEGLTFEELNGDDIRYVRDEDQIGYWGNLKFRMAVILFVVWGLNLTY